MTSFGWKRKAGDKLHKRKISVFESTNEEEEGSDYQNDVDWLSNRKIKPAISLEDSSTKSQRLKEEGCILAQTERYWEAIKKWDEAIHLAPNDERLFEMKAQALLELHEVYPAVQTANLAVKLNPQWWVAYQTLGRTQLGLGEVKIALRSFSKAVHLKPDNKELWEEDLQWAWSLLKRQRKALIENALQTLDTQNTGRASITELDEGPTQAVSGPVQSYNPNVQDNKKSVDLKSKKWIKLRSSPY